MEQIEFLSIDQLVLEDHLVQKLEKTQLIGTLSMIWLRISTAKITDVQVLTQSHLSSCRCCNICLALEA